MLPPLAQMLALCQARPDARWALVGEVPTAAGVPDLTAIELDQASVDERLSHDLQPVTDLNQVRTLLTLELGTLTPSQVSQSIGLTEKHIRRSLLPALCAAGWIQITKSNNGATIIEPLHQLRPIASTVVTVEAKLSDWRKACHQAMRHSLSSDQVYVALDLSRATSAIRSVADIQRLGIGLITVDASTGDVARWAPSKGRVTDKAMRIVLMERVWQLVLQGENAGPNNPVFGRRLNTLADSWG